MRLMYSGCDLAWIYERQDQISFLDGHVRAFAHFEGVPARVAYDNLRAAVVRILGENAEPMPAAIDHGVERAPNACRVRVATSSRLKPSAILCFMRRMKRADSRR